MDFVVLIKSNAESAQLFESIQQDAATPFNTQHSVEAMEVSWKNSSVKTW